MGAWGRLPWAQWLPRGPLLGSGEAGCWAGVLYPCLHSQTCASVAGVGVNTPSLPSGDRKHTGWKTKVGASSRLS